MRLHGVDKPRKSLICGVFYCALMFADRACIFDNSDSDRLWVAEVTEGVEIEMKSDEMPAWFKTALWDKFEQGNCPQLPHALA